jgi:hypothetical protein
MNWGNGRMMNNDLPRIENLVQNNNNVSTINQVISGSIHTFEGNVPEIKKYDPLTRSMIEEFQKLNEKKKLKVLTYIEELNLSS